MNDAQRAALQRLSDRYGVDLDVHDFEVEPFDLPPGYVSGWIGGSARKLYVGCDPDGCISS